MSLILTITDAGRQAIVNATNTGTLPITISHVALGSGRYNTSKTQTALQNEIKRITSFGGGAVDADVIHITIHDESTDSYSLGEFGLITNAGVLFAVYSNTGDPILEKHSNGMMVLSADIKVTTLDITQIEFSGTNFLLPPGTRLVAGVLKIADSVEAKNGENDTKAMTPKTNKEVLDVHRTGNNEHPISSISGLQDALDSKLSTNHPSVTNAREWTASTVVQADAEAGTATARSAWTAQRVRQAILGWWNTSAFKTKLDGIAIGATANATDAALRARSSHTGEQAISTVNGLQDALDSKLATNHSSVTNAREWTAATVTQVDAEAGTSTARTAWTAQRVRQAALSWWNSSAFKTKLDGIAIGATANATDAALRARSSHTGEQAINTVTGLQSALNAKQNNLGFAPVQQGTGVNQAPNTVKIGWSPEAKLKATVDVTDVGNFAMEGWVNTVIKNKEASQEDVDSGSGDNFITPEKLSFGFEFLAGQTGYIKLPKRWGGFTVQWGIVTSNVSANSTINWTYPKPFTEVFVSFPVHSNGGVTSEKAMINAHTLTNTQTRYNLSANGTQSVRWFAVGRI